MKRWSRPLAMTLAVLSTASARPALGQGGEPPTRPRKQAGQPGQPGQAGQPGQSGQPGQARNAPMANPAQRALLEQQVRQRIGNRMREELNLTEQQMGKLTELTRKYEEKHRLLQDQERDVRMSLREEVLRADSGRQGQINGLLERFIRNERQRVDLAEQEQKELASFLTPLQRAKYVGLQEVIRTRIQQLRQQAVMRNGRMRMQPQGMGPTGMGPNRMGPNGPPMGPGRPMGPPNGPPNGPPPDAEPSPRAPQPGAPLPTKRP